MAQTMRPELSALIRINVIREGRAELEPCFARMMKDLGWIKN